MSFLNTLFGNADQTQALGLLGSYLMAGQAPQGFQAAASLLSEAPMKRKRESLLDMQIEETKAQAEERRTKLDLARKNQEREDRFLYGDAGNVSPGAFSPDANGYGPVMPASQGGLIAQARQYGIPDQVIQADVLFNGGKKISEILNSRTAPRWENINGNLVNTNAPGFKGGFQPGMSVSNDGRAVMWQPDGQGGMVFGAPRGALETYGAYRGVDEGAKAAYDLVQTYNPQTKQMEYQPRAQVVRGSAPNQPQAAPANNPGGAESNLRSLVTGGMGADPAVIRREIQQSKASLPFVKDPASRAQLEAYIADLERQGQAIGMGGGGGVAAGPSASQKLADEAGGKINESWVKTSYEPTLATGAAARDLADTVKVTRQAMENMGGTGWGTQAKAAGASVLAGLGIAPQNAQVFAANAQVFQKTAMERLWTTLNEAKGPQTEGDAERASKTYASLANTPQANSFILDMAQAKAERDAMKARFYQQAMPIARQKGDLSEVDREWSKRAPSIFNMPTMQRWAGGIK